MSDKEAYKIMSLSDFEFVKFYDENSEKVEKAVDKATQALKKVLKLEKAIFEIENGISVHKRSRDYEKAAGMSVALKIIKRNLND